MPEFMAEIIAVGSVGKPEAKIRSQVVVNNFDHKVSEVEIEIMCFKKSHNLPFHVCNVQEIIDF